MSRFNNLVKGIELREDVSKTAVKLTFGFADGLEDNNRVLSFESRNRTWGSKIRKSIRGEQCFTEVHHNWRNVWETKPQGAHFGYLYNTDFSELLKLSGWKCHTTQCIFTCYLHHVTRQEKTKWLLSWCSHPLFGGAARELQQKQRIMTQIDKHWSTTSLSCICTFLTLVANYVWPFLQKECQKSLSHFKICNRFVSANAQREV